MKIVCRESDKYGEGKALHYIVPEKVDGRLLCCLRLRNMFNPEFRYYATRLDEKHTDEEILAMFGNREMRKEPFFVAI